jgi:hypothetical protein
MGFAGAEVSIQGEDIAVPGATRARLTESQRFFGAIGNGRAHGRAGQLASYSWESTCQCG